MCEFVDQSGNPLDVGDEIEFWGTEKEWIVSKVLAIETVRKMVRARNDNGDYGWVNESKTKILVQPDRHRNPTRSHSYNAVKLSKSANIRKVI